VVFPQFFDDQAHARTYGGEIFVNWKVTSRWRISPGYAYLSMNVARDPSSQDTNVAGIAGDTPKHKFEIRSLMSLTHHLNWDVALYHVNRLPDLEVRGYDRLDTRLAWQAGERTELSLVGQNLLTPRRQEFGDAFFLVHSEARRSVYGKVAWRF
jgi:iron complex outermembrane recepter protein